MVMMESEGQRVLSLSQLMADRTADCAESIALAAPGQTPLTYGRLGIHLEKMGRALGALGLGREDCVALALPPGPELAVAFLAVASHCICAPLPHACRVGPSIADLKAFNPKAIIIPSGTEPSAFSTTQLSGIPVLKLGSVRGVETGLFTLSGLMHFDPVASTMAEPDDVALVIRPSGPERQRVVVTHADLCAKAHCMAADLGFGVDHRTLNLMSLPFIDRFIEGAVAAFVAGASVMCCPPGEASQHYTRLAHCDPTWSEILPWPESHLSRELEAVSLG